MWISTRNSRCFTHVRGVKPHKNEAFGFRFAQMKRDDEKTYLVNLVSASSFCFHSCGSSFNMPEGRFVRSGDWANEREEHGAEKRGGRCGTRGQNQRDSVKFRLYFVDRKYRVFCLRILPHPRLSFCKYLPRKSYIKINWRKFMKLMGK